MKHYYVCYMFSVKQQHSYSFAVQSVPDEFDPADFIKSIREMKNADLVIIQNWLQISDYQKAKFDQILSSV